MLRIVITGGPGAGKTEIMRHLTRTLEKRGYNVFVVPESATELLLHGIHPGKHITPLEFQKIITAKQVSKEQLYARASAKYKPHKVVILYDRGICDSAAYLTAEEFEELLAEQGLTRAQVFAGYDAVLHLVTAADGAEPYYQWNDPEKPETGNNAARSESPERARERDRRTLEAWEGHPYRRIFRNDGDFAGKVRRVTEEILTLLESANKLDT